MRRPSPLPPPPQDVAKTPRAEAASPPVSSEVDERAGAVDDERSVAPLAPVIPFTGTDGAALARPDAAIADSTATTTTVNDERATLAPIDAEPASVSVGDVWAAARARRKALRGEVRRFTGRQRRRRMTWLAVTAALLILVLGTLGAAYSPLFSVERITVAGAADLDAGEVEDALSSQLGVPLPLVNASEIKAALVGFPLVETYTLEARPPHELVVRIVERTPIGAYRSPAGYTLVDAAGVALSTTPSAPDGYPLLTVTGGVASKAFAAVGQTFRSLPDDIRPRVSEIVATTPNDVTLTLGDTGTSIVWGSSRQSAMKALVLAQTMAARPGQSLYDVSSPNAVVVR